jgi:hypothetical protein
MCVAQPNRASVPDSWRALSSAIAVSAHAALLLLVAVATLPFRLLGRGFGGSRQHTRPAPVSQIGIEVHLDDRRCVAEITSALRGTLERSARTWAPHPLPLDRIVVGAAFPPEGTADIYDDWTEVPPRAGKRASHSLVVVSLGLWQGERDLEPFEIAGSLSAQIHRLVDERYRRRKPPSAGRSSAARATTTAAPGPSPEPAVTPAAPAPPRVSRGAASSGPSQSRSAAGAGMPARPAASSELADPGTSEGAGIGAMLDVLKRGQPLAAAGPSVAGDPARPSTE